MGDIYRATLAGSVWATLAKAVILLGGYLVNLSRFNLYNLLGSIFVRSVRAPWSLVNAVGLGIDLILGIAAGLIYASLAKDRSNVFWGAIYGIALWIISGLSIFAFSLGPTLWSMGSRTTMATLTGYLVYGAVLGATLATAVKSDKARA
ncbi:MAG TPA: YqhR family membrane protein [Bacillota bacterium]